MRGPEFLRRHVGKIRSRMGGVALGSHVIMRGVELHATFRDASWFDLYLFSITGRRFSVAQLELLQSIWVYTNYPETRLWNNRVAALCGTARSTGTLALAAATAVSEGTIYGGGNHMPVVDFLLRTLRSVQAGRDLGECIDGELRVRRRLPGFGRPLVSADERIVPILARARELGLDQGPHLKLVFDIERLLSGRRKSLRANYASVIGGLVADMGFSPRDFYLFAIPIFMAGMTPCFIEAAENPEAQLFPVPCEDIDYTGSPPRSWSG